MNCADVLQQVRKITQVTFSIHKAWTFCPYLSVTNQFHISISLVDRADFERLAYGTVCAQHLDICGRVAAFGKQLVGMLA